MKVKCSKCKHVISVSDEKLEGKEGKIKLRCPACKTPLAVKVPAKTSLQTEGDAVWYYSLEGNQEGPVTLAVMKGLIVDGKVHGGMDVWRPGLDAWVKASVLPELWEGTGKSAAMEAPVAGANEVFTERTVEVDAAQFEGEPGMPSRTEASMSALSAEMAGLDEEAGSAKAALERSKAYLAQSQEIPLGPAPASQPAPAEEKSDGDLFGGFAGGSSDGLDDHGDSSDQLTHARRETSVLFSLDEMNTGKKGKGKKKQAEVVDDSGLIDIRRMAVEKRDDDIFASFGGSQGGPTEDSAITAGKGGLSQASVATVALKVPILKRKKKWPFVVAAATVGLVVILGGGGFYWAFNAFYGTGSPKWLEDQLRTAHTNALNEATTLSKKALDQITATKDAKVKEVEGKIDALRTEHQKRYASLDAEAAKARKELSDRFQEELDVLNKEKADLQGKVLTLAGEKKVVVVQQPATPDGKTPENPANPQVEQPNPATDGGKKVVNKGGTTTNKGGSTTNKGGSTTNPVTDGGGTQAVKQPEVKNDGSKTGGKTDDAAAILQGVDSGSGSGSDAGAASGKKGLTSTDVTKAVGEAKGAMRECFTKYGGGLESVTIRTKVTIAPSGEVTAVTISSMEYAGTALGNCVRSAQMNMKFPAFSGGPVSKPVSVRLP